MQTLVALCPHPDVNPSNPAGDMGRAEASQEVRLALENATWLTHWGLHTEHRGARWAASHRPGQVRGRGAEQGEGG